MITETHVWSAEPAPPIDMLEQVFSSHNWSFERDGDEEIVASVKGGWSEYQLRALWREEERVLQFIAVTGIQAATQIAEPASRARLYEVLGLINEQLWLGHFELWQGDGAIAFRHAVLIDGDDEACLSFPQTQALVDAAIDECERHYPAFQFALWSDRSPVEALKAAMTETSGEA